DHLPQPFAVAAEQRGEGVGVAGGGPAEQVVGLAGVVGHEAVHTGILARPPRLYTAGLAKALDAGRPGPHHRGMTPCVYALSLKQPWAALLVHGRKSVEVRSWPTARRGRVLIHAA